MTYEKQKKVEIFSEGACPFFLYEISEIFKQSSLKLSQISVNGMILHKRFHPIVKVKLLELTPNMFLRSRSLNLNGMLDT
jgi:hypothetical protein